MIVLIFAYVVYIIFSCFLAYSIIELDIWHNRKPLDLKKPSIYDLTIQKENVKSAYDYSKYVDEVIIPSHDYFILRDSLVGKNYSDLDKFGAVFIFEMAAVTILTVLTANEFPNYDINNFLYWLIIIVVTVVLCVSILIVSIKIFKKKIYQEFYFSLDELKREFAIYGPKSDLPEEKAFNNFAISKHYKYLLSIKGEVNFQHKVRTVIIYIAIIAIILFGMFPQILI